MQENEKIMISLFDHERIVQTFYDEICLLSVKEEQHMKTQFENQILIDNLISHSDILRKKQSKLNIEMYSLKKLSFLQWIKMRWNKNA